MVILCKQWLDILSVGQEGGFHHPQGRWLVEVFIAWVFWEVTPCQELLCHNLAGFSQGHDLALLVQVVYV